MNLVISKNWRALPAKHTKRGAVFGSFDGLHHGHLALLNDLISWKKQNKDSEIILISLYPHPQRILSGRKVGELLRLRQAVDILEDLGIDRLHFIKFSKNVSELTAREFIQNTFVDLCDLDYLVIGPDAKIGKDRMGDSEFIKSELLSHNCIVKIMEESQVNGVKIGSRYIRSAIEAGDPQMAKALLGRAFEIYGRVVRGDQRGRKLGFPTANISLSNYVVPAYGVYLVKLTMHNKTYAGVANIGIRPTFQGSTPLLEVHLLDYQGEEFYGSKVNVELIERIRPEKKFSSFEELKQQIASDCIEARKYFNLS